MRQVKKNLKIKNFCEQQRFRKDEIVYNIKFQSMRALKHLSKNMMFKTEISLS